MAQPPRVVQGTDSDGEPLCVALLHEYCAVGAYQLVEASTDPDGGWHTEACHAVQHVASNFCFDLLTGICDCAASPHSYSEPLSPAVE
jgi:hypothetical protein